MGLDELEKEFNPGSVVLFGSGETLASSGKTYEYIARQSDDGLRIAVLETPAGFEPNSERVAGAVAEFINRRLQNYNPKTSVIPARKKGTQHSPDDPQILEPLLDASWIFLGPGSPTYARRQLQDSLAYNIMVARHRLGARLLLASAATLAMSSKTLPVYEIYKVGEELHWQPGLDFFKPYGLSLIFIPHWNNTDGGADLDTSRCYMGRKRFERLVAMLPEDSTIVGLDEHTALVIEFADACCKVMGNNGVTVIKGDQEVYYHNGSVFPITVLGEFRIPKPGDMVPANVWDEVQKSQIRSESSQHQIPAQVLTLIDLRKQARLQQDWKNSDRLRDQIAELGWEVRDTTTGVELVKIE